MIISICIIRKAYVRHVQNNTLYESLPNYETDENVNNINEQTFTNCTDMGRLVVSAIILIIWMLLAIICQDSIELRLRYIIWPVVWVCAYKVYPIINLLVIISIN
ncbi:37877_t:CDS:1, partial [Gigaspora margarita]